MNQFGSTLLAVKGGLNLAAGALRVGHLDFLSDEVRDRRADLKAARDAADAAIAKAKTSSAGADIIAAIEAQAKVDKATYDTVQAQAVLDRAQSEQAFYQAMGGVADLGAGLFGFGGTGGMGGMGGMGGDALMTGLAAAGGGFAGSLLGSRRSDDKSNP